MNLGAVPLDPNSPLHALALGQLADGGSWGEISNLAFPTPVPIRMVALPTLLLGLPFSFILSPLAALNAATTCMVALQGLAIAWLVALLGWGRRAQFIAITGGICAPFTIHAQALGQQENLGFLAMAIAVAAALSQGRKAWLLTMAALLTAGFSSPYQAVPTGLLLLSVSALQGKQVLLRSVLCAAIAAIPVLLYYTGATDGSASIPGITTSPPEEGYLASAGLWDMLHPRAMWDASPVTLDGALKRLSNLGQTIPFTELHPGWIWTTAHQSAYLGLVLLFGIKGIWNARKHGALFRGLFLGASLCLLLALGPSLRIVSEQSTGVPMPWAGLAAFPGLSDLQATHRFLAGTVFVLVLGLAWWGRNLARHWVATLCALLMVDGLLRAPVIWPLPGARTDLQAVEAELPPGPVMLWPPLTAFAPQYYELMAVLLDRPVGIYTPSGVTLSGEITYTGQQTGYLRMDVVKKSRGDTPFEVLHATTLPSFGPWKIDVEVDLGKVNLIVFLDVEGNGPDPNEPQTQIEGISVAYQNISDLNFKLTDPGITAEEVAASRSEPLQPGTKLPSDLPDLSGNISQEDWLQRGAFGGAKSLLRTRSGLSDEDSGFNLSPQQLKMSASNCVGEFHCVQTLELTVGPPRHSRP